ncbi:MAG: penicillin-binding protein activator [Methanoregula sp.]|nr:penicillin-binding protein activator [Methanoregula sp.]
MKHGAIIALLLIFTGIVFSGCLGQQTSPLASKEIVIGALVPLTGDWSSKGQNFSGAITLAVQDVNDNLASSGSPDRVKLLVEDTATDPDVAQEKIRNLHDAGVRVVVGPATSAEIIAVKDWADQHGMVIIGYASTSPALSIPGDNVFRLVPDDSRQGEAMAAFMNQSGIRVVIPVVRNDTWGTNLLLATKNRFEKSGGVITAGYPFEPGTRDYAPIVRNLSIDVAAAQHQYGTGAVGVYAIGFDELVPLFSSAANDPVLGSVRWFGSDGSAKADALVKNATAARFAVKTGFSAPVYGVEKETGSVVNLTQRIKAITGSEPDGYSLAAYDATAIAARSLMVSRDAPADQLKKAVEFTADYYYGITGWTKFVASGDRAYAVYPFWTIQAHNGTYAWERIATYKSDPDQPGRFV